MPPTAIQELLRPSRYATGLIAARPELGAELAAGLDAPFAREEMRAALARLAEGSDAEAKTALRRLRQRVFLRAMARDLAGLAGLDEVCATMSDLAEAAIEAALARANAELLPDFGAPCDAAGAVQPLIVVGMGKLGGRELNVSSDIDLVLLYPEDGDTGGAACGAARSLSNHEYFTRAGRRVIALLAEPTADGIVFRVDMRLRPNGDSGPLVSSYPALETYLITQGREWERYAWIKARPMTGGAAHHAGLEAIRRPFVYRKYLDYASLAAMRQLHAEVRREVARRDLADHIKLGPGGIREIEFIAQALQLVRGGRDPALAARPTRTVLALLAQRKMLSESAARELAADYVSLRNLEHRLQYLDDAQTHRLPQSEEDRARISAMSGLSGWAACERRLRELRERVATHFQAVFAEDDARVSPFDDAWQDDARAVAEVLAQHGYRDAQGCARRIVATRASQRYTLLPDASRRRFDSLVPQLAAAATRTASPDATLLRGLDLIEAVARRAAYLALLAEHPQALSRVARMIGASSWAAQFVTQHPLLLDELLDDRVLYADADWPEFGRELRAQLAAFGDDPERQMNVLREAHQAQVFRLLAKDLAGRLTVERLADELSALADLVLEITLDLVWSRLRGRHRERPRFAVIAYGKLGGKELGYASDLDIIFLYDDADEAAPETYARFAQRINTWLSSRTSSGALFDTDLRLRPSGASGLLVSSIAAFREYQEKQAWSWEHQALTRARSCAGDRAVGAQFEAIREEVLRRKRDAAALAQEVQAMREKMHAAHPNASGRFDVKHDRGGMIDIEFAVQFLVLAHAHRHPQLTGNLGNIALLRIAAELGLVPAPRARAAREAYREFRRIQHALRLNGASYARVPPEGVAAHAAAVRAFWDGVFG
ncbi:MAG: bifunctional [glutamate--ammonia ligase]-adenylyl-L-tyrosine phosphorylase/[glutamate--ammonia-ligase] adenylyltransferase [Betaproteobacteria bacterium]|nr:bifunctional [glutamate--ammonia ligase]-adenylyl-L-tyrosine phosphorylase/[glutamate--ammonia-ligase] adenylyltransferase [Betaproteobacteria bacterium]